MKPRVFITRPLPDAVLAFLSACCEIEVYPEDSLLSAERLAAGCRDAEGLLVVSAPVGQDVVERAPRLRVVSTPSVGYDNIDVRACTRRQILVTNTAGVLEETTADLAFALLLALARRLPEGDRFVRSGRWREWQWGLLHGANVHHKTLALYGFGRIGQAMARRGRGFAMRILYYSRRQVALAIERELEAQYADRETLLREADFLSLHIPLTEESRRVIGSRELSLMKPSAFLINAARGPVVDEAALVEALEKKVIAGAALDVFEREPQVHPGLLRLENVVLMPHAGSATAETRLRMARLAAENLVTALKGERPPNLVNPEAFGLPDPSRT